MPNKKSDNKKNAQFQLQIPIPNQNQSAVCSLSSPLHRLSLWESESQSFL